MLVQRKQLPVATPTPAVPSPIIAYDDAAIQYLGRWIDTGSGMWCGWSGSQIVLKVSGTLKLTVFTSVVDPDTTTNICLLTSYVDNTPNGTAAYDSAVYKAANFYYLTNYGYLFTGNVFQEIDLPDTGEHTIILHTNGIRSGMWASTQKTVITGFLVDNGGLISSWQQGTKRLQTVGDSWMAADADWPRLMDRTRWELYPVSHGGLTCAVINTDYNYDYGTTAATDTTADAVIFSEGVNSSNAGITQAAFETSLGQLVDKIRAKQASAPIILIRVPSYNYTTKNYGKYGTSMANVATAKSNCYYYDTTSLDATVTWNADTYHLDAAGKQILADGVDAYMTSIGV